MHKFPSDFIQTPEGPNLIKYQSELKLRGHRSVWRSMPSASLPSLPPLNHIAFQGEMSEKIASRMHGVLSYRYHSISLSPGSSPIHFPRGGEHLHLIRSRGHTLWTETIYEEERTLRFIGVKNKASPAVTHFLRHAINMADLFHL